MSAQTWLPSLMFLSLVLQSDEQGLDLSYAHIGRGKATYGAGRLLRNVGAPDSGSAVIAQVAPRPGAESDISL